ncbi:MAG: hypothetical protein O2983_16170 [Planctomycetota bacterium]|nr:hypothetical protein [Planctomycetota bacterium]MDA0918953.1 hypothetical protein [Planctomycetota bacterium]MDA1161140.1 hypothetical protein [Planctomycetota bacterium]
MSLETCLPDLLSCGETKLNYASVRRQKIRRTTLPIRMLPDWLTGRQLAAQKDLSTMRAAKFGESIQDGQPE